MSYCTSCIGASIKTEIVPDYDADILGAPFKVYLREAVKVEVCTNCGAVLNTAIPDPDGLMYTVLFSRALHPRKLTGNEIKFMRNLMGWKAKKLADELGISPEHLSRCENGHTPMSETMERLFRILAVLNPQCSTEPKTELTDKVRKIIKEAIDNLAERLKSFKIEATWAANEPLEFHFYRRRPENADGLSDGDDDGEWEPEEQVGKAAA